MEDVEDDEADQIASIVSSISPLPTTSAASTAATDNPATIIQGVRLVDNDVFNCMYCFSFTIE